MYLANTRRPQNQQRRRQCSSIFLIVRPQGRGRPLAVPRGDVCQQVDDELAHARQVPPDAVGQPDDGRIAVPDGSHAVQGRVDAHAIVKVKGIDVVGSREVAKGEGDIAGGARLDLLVVAVPVVRWWTIIARVAVCTRVAVQDGSLQE